MEIISMGHSNFLINQRVTFREPLSYIMRRIKSSHHDKMSIFSTSIYQDLSIIGHQNNQYNVDPYINFKLHVRDKYLTSTLYKFDVKSIRT